MKTLVIVLASLLGAGSFAQQPRPLPGALELEYARTLTVAGRGEVFAPPDRAIVRLGAEAQAKEAAEAQLMANQTVVKTVEAIKKLGIPEPAIRTSSLNLYPVYAPHRPDADSDEPRITGYRAVNTIEVRIDDMALVGKVIDAGMRSGVTRLEGISFHLRNELPQRSAALKLAIDEAEVKARAMAEALNVKLGKPRQVIEGRAGDEPVQPLFRQAERFAMASAGTPVQPGELRVEATVTIRFEIEP